MQTSTNNMIERAARGKILCGNLSECIELIDRSFGRNDMTREDVQTLADLRIKCDHLRETIHHAAAGNADNAALYDTLYESVPELTNVIRQHLGQAARAQ